MAIGRTMFFHTSTAMPIIVDSEFGSPPAATMPSVICGPRKYRRSGTNNPHASKPPVKLSAASSGPIFSGGLATSAFVAYLSSLTNLQFSATQYALLSSIMLLLPRLIGGYSGVLVEKLGYADFFMVTALIGLPTLLLIGVQWGCERRQPKPKPGHGTSAVGEPPHN